MGAITADRSSTKVLQALTNPKYVWRTLPGLEQETQLPREEILRVIDGMREKNLLTGQGRHGTTVFSTRDHYYKTRSVLSKILSGLSGELK